MLSNHHHYYNYQNYNLNSNQTTSYNNNENYGKIFETYLIGIACFLVLLLSLFGNSLVVFVILRYKRLQNATNYILLSLAIADLTVSVFVMLPSMIYDISHKWPFGELFCKIYNSFDITCCTASILHLLLVSVDRYVAIFKPLSYRNMVRKLHVFVMVSLVWLLSACLSFLPIFLGLNLIPESDYDDDDKKTTKISTLKSNLSIKTTTKTTTTKKSKPLNPNECEIEANLPYAIVSSSLSFYIPLIIMSIVYIQIFIVARKQALAMAEIDQYCHYNNNNNIIKENNSSTNHNNSHQNHHTSNNNSPVHRKSDDSGCPNDANGTPSSQNKQHLNINNNNNNNLLKSYSCNTIDNNIETNKRLLKIKQNDSKRKRRSKDTKAIKTLGIIMGIFIICWLPFFVMYLYIATCEHLRCGTEISKPIARLITWIGYVNSFINPIVYALTNRDFRKAYITTLTTIVNLICPCILKKFNISKKYVINGENFSNHHSNQNNYYNRNRKYILNHDLIKTTTRNTSEFAGSNKLSIICCFLCNKTIAKDNEIMKKNDKKKCVMNNNNNKEEVIESHENNNNNVNHNIKIEFGLNSDEDLNKKDYEETDKINMQLVHHHHNHQITSLETTTTTTANHANPQNLNIINDKMFFSFAALPTTTIAVSDHISLAAVHNKKKSQIYNDEKQNNQEIMPLNDNTTNRVGDSDGDLTSTFSKIKNLFLKRKTTKKPVQRL